MCLLSYKSFGKINKNSHYNHYHMTFFLDKVNGLVSWSGEPVPNKTTFVENFISGYEYKLNEADLSNT